MNLTAEQIITIIKECKGSVAKLKLSKNSIEVDFLSKPIEQQEIPASEQPTPEEKNSEQSTEKPKVIFHPEKDPEEEKEEELLDNLMIEDPLRHEELIAMGELEDVEKDRGSE